MERLTGWIPPVVIDNSPPIILPDRSADWPFLVMTEAVISGLGTREARRLFGEFLRNEESLRVIRRIRGFFSQPPERQFGLRSSFRGRRAGDINETLSFMFLRRRIKDTEILFSPAETSEFIRSLYKGRQTPPEPDGLLFTRSEHGMRLAGICEYSLSEEDRPRKLRQRKFHEDIDGFLTELSLLGNIAIDRSNFKIIYVRPKSDRKNRVSGLFYEYNLPFSRSEFREVLDGIFSDAENSLGLRVE